MKIILLIITAICISVFPQQKSNAPAYTLNYLTTAKNLEVNAGFALARLDSLAFYLTVGISQPYNSEFNAPGSYISIPDLAWENISKFSTSKRTFNSSLQFLTSTGYVIGLGVDYTYYRKYQIYSEPGSGKKWNSSEKKEYDYGFTANIGQYIYERILFVMVEYSTERDFMLGVGIGVDNLIKQIK